MRRFPFITHEPSAPPRPPRAAWLILFAFWFAGIHAVAQQITTTGLTATTLSLTGGAATVTTATIVGGTGFNSLGRFNVNSGNTVRLVVPSGATNLIVIATNGISSIHGALVVSEGATPDAHVFFLNPNGWMFGRPCSVVAEAENVTIASPTLDWCRTFFDATNTPNPGAVAALLTGAHPVSATAAVSVVGRFGARGSIDMRVGRLSVVLGSLVAGDGTDPILKGGDISIDSVNDVSHGIGEIVARNGNVHIHSDGKVKVLWGRMTATGNIELQAGDEVCVGLGASVCAGSNVVMQGSNLVQVAEKGNVHAGGSVIMKSANQTVITNTAYVVSQSAEGSPYPAVQLVPGWNLMAYNSPLVSPVSNLLAGIAGKYSMVCTHAGTDWKFYDPTNTAGNTLTNFEPGVGYWINATEATNLTLP